MTYPEYANIRGKRYKLNTDFKTGLRCFEVINDASICGEERALAVIYMLFGFIPDGDLINDFLDKTKIFLQCGETKEQQEEKKSDMDFTADSKYINASFMSDYHIDLNKADLHFWQFCELIEGLTEHCVLSRVRELRTTDLNDFKDAKTKMKIAKAQADVALPEKRTREELKAIEDFENLFKE